MLKIVKSRVYNFDGTNAVPLGEPAPKSPTEPEKTEPDEPEISPEELARLEEERLAKKAAEEEERFNRAVRERVDYIIAQKRAALEAEYNRVVSSGEANAERMIEDAKTKTRAVFEAADEECARLKERSRREGFDAGFDAGRNEAMKTCEKYLEAAAKLLSDINAKKEAYYISNEYEMCRTVMDMVKRITFEEIKTDPGVIDRICADAAKSFRNSDYLKISLSQGEASRAMVTDKEFVKSIISFIPEIEVEELAPEDAPAGTIVLDNGSEIIDASIPTQLEFLKEIMKSSRGESEEEQHP
ncbi:MAG: hypothetical protein NC120_01455 [Ruminococcus sp.]|nr:hypothetical protein [Ruminococcus sp.]